MTGRTHAQNVAIITATPQARAQLENHYTLEGADKAIRSARRQVQRYGEEAREGLLSWCVSDDDRAFLSRALDTHVRVGTVVREWDERTRSAAN